MRTCSLLRRACSPQFQQMLHDDDVDDDNGGCNNVDDTYVDDTTGGVGALDMYPAPPLRRFWHIFHINAAAGVSRTMDRIYSPGPYVYTRSYLAPGFYFSAAGPFKNAKWCIQGPGPYLQPPPYLGPPLPVGARVRLGR